MLSKRLSKSWGHLLPLINSTFVNWKCILWIHHLRFLSQRNLGLKKMQFIPQNCTKCEVFDPKSAKKRADLLDFSLLNRLSLKSTFYFMKIVGSQKCSFKSTFLLYRRLITLSCMVLGIYHVGSCPKFGYVEIYPNDLIVVMFHFALLQL